MESCGYIYTGDVASNLQNKIKLEIYPCGSADKITADMTPWRCCISKSTLHMIESDTGLSPLNRLALRETARTAIRFDKKLIFPSLLSYKTDDKGNPVLRFESNIKEVFPVPDKTAVFGEIKNYVNMTSVFGNEEYFTPLFASVVCDMLNWLALSGGYVDDRIFYQSCGRLFADGDFFMSCVVGRHMLKKSFAHGYEVMKNIYKGIEVPQKLFLKRYRVRLRSRQEIKSGALAALRHNAACRLAATTGLFGFAAHADTVRTLAEALVVAVRDAAQNLALNGALEKAADAEYLSEDEIAAARFDPKCRADLNGLARNSRKFFNSAKDKMIVCMDSCGRIYQ